VLAARAGSDEACPGRGTRPGLAEEREMSERVTVVVTGLGAITPLGGTVANRVEKKNHK